MVSPPFVPGELAAEEPRHRKRLWPLLVLSVVVYSTWTVWALWIHRWSVLSGSPGLEKIAGVGARLVSWCVPSLVYLFCIWGRHQWAHPLGLGFPLGRRQALRTVLLTVLVTWALFAATAARNSIPLGVQTADFWSVARPRLVAPVFEELVFRGVFLSELLDWTHRNSKSLGGLRARYWGAQLTCAVFFVLIHWPAWWAHLGYSAAIERSLPIFAVALVLGFIFAHTRSIWPCIWLHWLNNELSLMA